ncbi:MAG TPA: hypothetical protein PLP33_07150 [Leptospiraceae bacterium]|jgi:hypothetical protein|nr:hypothetical protein [Leptospiraceae bacterium]
METEKQDRTEQLRFSDQLIGQLASLITIAMVTQTNVVDHFRMIRVEESDQKGMEGKLVLTKDYVEVYNKQVEELTKMIEEQEKTKQ